MRRLAPLLALTLAAAVSPGCKSKAPATAGSPAAVGGAAPSGAPGTSAARAVTAEAPKPLPAPPLPGRATSALRRGKAPAAPVPLADFVKAERVDGASFSHDERLVAYVSDRGGRQDLWVQPLDGGTARQLTQVKGFVHSFAFSPTEDRLAFEADLGGDELPHLYLTSSKGEAPVDLTAGDPKGARTQFLRWSDDGKRLLYLSSRRDPRFLDLYELTLETRTSELVWQASARRSLELVSRDHGRAILLETLSDADTNLYLWERGEKRETLLTPHTGEVLHGAADLSHDGKALYLTSDGRGEYQVLESMDLATRRRTVVLSLGWDVERALVSRTGRYLVTETNVDGEPQITLEDQTSRAALRLPSPPGGGVFVPVAFSKSDRLLAVRRSADTAPPTLYVVDVAALRVPRGATPPAAAARKLVEPLPERLRARPMASGRVVRIATADRREVPAFLYLPPGKGPFPALIDVHGGPTAQSKREYAPWRQYLVSKGWAVLVPNVRGSTGYGKTFMRADNLDLGGGPLRDVVACKEWLVAHAAVDPERVVVMGGSYGGYMALAAAAFEPTRFAALVDYFGPSDLRALVESFPPYWASYATFVHKKFGDPKNPQHAAYQRARSPLFAADRIVRPLLVVQGANDARVKQAQSDQLVAALRARKAPVHYLLLEGEGHGFSKTESRLAALVLTDRFLDRYVWGDAAVRLPDEAAPAPDAAPPP